ncbi:hypothetical protein CYMTET_53085, partial [Cymbomonas tetramitiformis]
MVSSVVSSVVRKCATRAAFPSTLISQPFTISSLTSRSSGSLRGSLSVPLTKKTHPEPQGAHNFRTMTPIMMGRRSAKIAGKKGKTDALRAKLYGKLCKKIVQAAKGPGGPDPIANSTLAEAIKAAKTASVPNDLIERNVKKASDAKTADYTEVTYEAYGHGGVGVVIEGLTDNLNRAASEVRDVVKKGGAKMAESGSVLFQFERKGLVYVKGDNEDEIMEAAMEGGAEDLVQKGEMFEILSSFEDYTTVKSTLLEAGYEVSEERSGLVLKPMAMIE